MLKNYFKIAWRNLFKHKGFSFINVSGLALGLASCLLILQYVRHELSYDTFQKNGDRIYRLKQNRYDQGVLTTEWAAGTAGIAQTVKQNFPEVEPPDPLTKRLREGILRNVAFPQFLFQETNTAYTIKYIIPVPLRTEICKDLQITYEVRQISSF